MWKTPTTMTSTGLAAGCARGAAIGARQSARVAKRRRSNIAAPWRDIEDGRPDCKDDLWRLDLDYGFPVRMEVKSRQC
jgi:hypothetical protein